MKIAYMMMVLAAAFVARAEAEFNAASPSELNALRKGGAPMKVMTYNIRYSAGDRNSADNNWEARRDDLANLVESANPDVAGFQEVLPDQRKWLEARFPGYAFVGEGRNADRVNGEASPIAFRKDRFEPVKSGTFWLSETPDEPGSAKLVFDTSNAPDLRKWTEEKFAPAMCEWVVNLTGIMASDGWEPPKDILFKFVVEPLQWDTNAPAWASSTEGRVSLRVDWFRANLNGEALGATIHELTHIMQAYWSKGQNKDNCPDWAVEGYAAYIRWILFEPESDGCGYVRNDIKKYHYNDSYRVTALFFGFVESRYPGTMKKLNAAMRDHTFDNGKF